MDKSGPVALRAARRYCLSVHIRVLYFAVFRERLRSDGETQELPDGATVDAALAALGRRHPAIRGLLPSVKAAVNQEIAPPGRVLRDGDELAIIPPVAGGVAQRIAVLPTPLSLDAVVAAVSGEAQGGVVTFTGVVRRHGQQANVDRLEYEAFVPMAEAVLRQIADELEARLPGTRVAIHHRTGTLAVGEVAVVIAASAPHRAEAFEACRGAIEELKLRAPIWKKEIGQDGAEWIGLGP